jgi:hypothetical protein
MDGRRICITTPTIQRCSGSQLALTLTALINQLLGTALAIVFPLIPQKAAEWVAAAAYLVMTLSIAMAVALTISESTLHFFHNSILPEGVQGRLYDTSGLYLIMVVCSVLTWMSFWVFHSRVNFRHSVTGSE